MVNVHGHTTWARAWFAVVTFAAIVAHGACSSDPPATVLQGLDFEKPKGLEADAKFDRNTLLTSAAFVDTDAIDAVVVQKFLQKTPYDRPSFLATHQSNGVRASDAIARASRNYRINALVLLVFAQTMQGLVGEANYPFPPERVEYVFRCGCLQSGNCLPELAGFDRQVDCLGRELRTSLDEIAKAGVTTAGWGPDKTSLTLDNLKVTPSNDGTAVFYDRVPVVAEGQAGGSWIFWNVFNLYASKLNYAGPVGAPGSGGFIGDACVADASCGYADATCATNYPGGLCTAACTGECPSRPDRPQAYCAAFPTGGFCFQVCNPGAPACRTGYTCVRVAKFRGAPDESSPVCYPDTAAK